ncbi:MAG: cell division protein ZapA [Gammaproteobacteria bacterium]|nr:cell division protein ZapA [Gammaproteobacteria bacterium]
MSKQPAHPVNIKILDREYKIACPADEEDGLLASAEYLNSKMNEIRDSGKVVGMDRIAIMAALNIANELLQYNTHRTDYHQSMGTRIRSLQEKIELALNQSKQLEL